MTMIIDDRSNNKESWSKLEDIGAEQLHWM